jgi:D-serine deaminase-like pyridoxal phosphate-dependent protein
MRSTGQAGGSRRRCRQIDDGRRRHAPTVRRCRGIEADKNNPVVSMRQRCDRVAITDASVRNVGFDGPGRRVRQGLVRQDRKMLEPASWNRQDCSRRHAAGVLRRRAVRDAVGYPVGDIFGRC